MARRLTHYDHASRLRAVSPSIARQTAVVLLCRDAIAQIAMAESPPTVDAAIDLALASLRAQVVQEWTYHAERSPPVSHPDAARLDLWRSIRAAVGTLDDAIAVTEGTAPPPRASAPPDLADVLMRALIGGA
jgi:hypothetical protein